MQEEELTSTKEIYKYFLDEFPMPLLFGEIKPANPREEVVLEMFNRLNDVHSVMERLDKYEIYFEYFVPANDKVSEAEAIEYHLHSYLEDMYSLREKINRMLGYLKNKIMIFNIANIEDVKSVLLHLQTQVDNGLTQVLELRGRHVHDFSVRDLDLTKAKLLQTAGTSLGLNEDQIKERYEKLIASAREKYIRQSERNKKELQKMKDFFFPRLGHIFASVYGHDPVRFEPRMSKTGEI